MSIIKLPPASGITGKYLTKQGHYDSYKIWRKSEGYRLWLKKQWYIQKGKCFYCKQSLKSKGHNVEHVTPQSAYGTTTRENMVLSCPQCNKEKGSILPSKELVRKTKVYNHNKRTNRRRNKIR